MVGLNERTRVVRGQAPVFYQTDAFTLFCLENSVLE